LSREKGFAQGFVDQALSSASNVLVVFAVARVSSVDAFGVAALLLTVLTVALAVARGFFGTPLLLLGGHDDGSIAAETRHALGGAVILGCMVGPVIWAVGAILGHTAVAIPLAIATPLVLGEDAHRFSAISRGRSEMAVVWDGVWALGSAVILVATWVFASALDGPRILAMWAALAGVSFVGFTVSSRLRPSLAGLSRWLSVSLGDRFRYGLEAGVGASSSLIVISIAAVFIGPAAIAALRGAGSIMGPLSLVMSAIPLAVIPAAVKAEHTPARTWVLLRKLGAGMSLVAVLVGFSSVFIPVAVGQALLGQSWLQVSKLLPITGLEYAGVAWVAVMNSALRTEGRSVSLLRSRTIYAVCSIFLSACAAWWWGTAVGVAWALAASAAVAAVVMRKMCRSTRTTVPT
jgi:hypothetical protein